MSNLKPCAYLTLALFFFTMFSCGGDNTNSCVSKTLPELKIGVSGVVNGNTIVKNKYFHLKNGDSILVSRLDFYMDKIEFSSKQGCLSSLDSTILYSLNSVSNQFVFKNITLSNSSIDTLKFICGLTDAHNNGNPNSYPETHPLSSWKNMYWTDWSKYRFVILEGNIKKPNGDLINYSFHTGLIYKGTAKIGSSSSIDLSSSKTHQLKMNIEKIFYPSDASFNIKYDNGETNAHADALDGELTGKVANNVSLSFSFE